MAPLARMLAGTGRVVVGRDQHFNQAPAILTRVANTGGPALASLGMTGPRGLDRDGQT